jgi:hypothetical protein
MRTTNWALDIVTIEKALVEMGVGSTFGDLSKGECQHNKDARVNASRLRTYSVKSFLQASLRR